MHPLTEADVADAVAAVGAVVVVTVATEAAVVEAVDVAETVDEATAAVETGHKAKTKVVKAAMERAVRKSAETTGMASDAATGVVIKVASMVEANLRTKHV